MSGLSAPNGTDINFASFEDHFPSWTCVHSCLPCLHVRTECSVGKTRIVGQTGTDCRLPLAEAGEKKLLIVGVLSLSSPKNQQ